ncbi:MAG TPA: hypothetical protein PLZ15_02575 [Melioribacteraceae bacterium]|nr:hypothetical protein [Melioribacteraceae bacterium]
MDKEIFPRLLVKFLQSFIHYFILIVAAVAIVSNSKAVIPVIGAAFILGILAVIAEKRKLCSKDQGFLKLITFISDLFALDRNTKIEKNRVAVFIKIFIGFSASLFVVSYYMFGEVNWIWIVLVSILFSLSMKKKLAKTNNVQ